MPHTYTKDQMDTAWAALSPAARQALLDRAAAEKAKVMAGRSDAQRMTRNYNDCMDGCRDMHHIVGENMAPGGMSPEAAKAIEEMMSECYRACHESNGVPHGYDD